MSRSVRCYLLPSTADAPNNPLPVVHYRGVIPQPSDEAATTAFLTGNGWEKRVRFEACSLLFSFRVLDLARFSALSLLAGESITSCYCHGLLFVYRS